MNLKGQIRHSISATVVVVIGAQMIIYYSIVRWETIGPVPSWNLAIFPELAKVYAHLQIPIVLAKDDGYSLLGDHFHPILALLGSIWGLFPMPLNLFITRDLLLVFSTQSLTRLVNRLTNQWVAGRLELVCALFWGIQRVVTVQFYEIVFAMSLLAYASVAFVGRRWGTVTAWSAPLALVREDMGLAVLMIEATVILISAVPAWYHMCTAIRPDGHGANGFDAARDVTGNSTGSALQNSTARNRRRGLRLGVGMIIDGIAAFLFAIQVFLPALSINGVQDYGLSSQDQPISPGAPIQKTMAAVMLILTSGIVGVIPPWLLVVLPTLAWRFLGSVEFYWMWDSWRYNAALMSIVLGALLDVVAQHRTRGSYMADHPVGQVGVDGRVVIERSAQTALATEEVGEVDTAGESDVGGPRRCPTVFPTWLTMPMRHRFVVATSILTAVVTGMLITPYLPLQRATNKNFGPLTTEAKQSDETRRTEMRRVAVAHGVIATIPEGAAVATDLSLLAYLVLRAEVSWAGTSGPDREYIAMTPTSANQWDSSDAATWGKKHFKQGTIYTLIHNKDSYQTTKRND